MEIRRGMPRAIEEYRSVSRKLCGDDPTSARDPNSRKQIRRGASLAALRVAINTKMSKPERNGNGRRKEHRASGTLAFYARLHLEGVFLFTRTKVPRGSASVGNAVNCGKGTLPRRNGIRFEILIRSLPLPPCPGRMSGIEF